MGKLLLWAIAILAALIVMRLWTHHKAHGAARRNQPTARHSGDVPPEAMVRCAHCGIHLPRSEALMQHGQLWCCEEHARLGHPGNSA